MGDSARMSSKARWAVPAGAAVAVVGLFAGPPLLASAGSSGLPAITPQELVAAVASHQSQALSGTVAYTARLGLPSLPLGSASDSADPTNLLSGTTTMRVWTDGQERSRVSLIGQTSEYSVVADGPQAWTYSSAKNAVVHFTLDAAAAKQFQAEHGKVTSTPSVAPSMPTPGQLADQSLAQVQKFSTVTVEGQSKVAGRDAYELVVTPQGGGTLVSRVVVAVDSQTKTPLSVQVWSTTNTKDPALEVGFTSVRFAMPSSAVLTFSPPKGASVQQKVVGLPAGHPMAPSAPSATGGLPHGATVHGTGWATVVERSVVPEHGRLQGHAPTTVPAPSGAASSGPGMLGQLGGSTPGMGGDQAALLNELTTKVPQGRLLSSALISVLITNDGHVLAGAVPAATLQALA